MRNFRPARATRSPRLGASHGYRFHADTVRLQAMFTVVDAAAHSRSWALQLWACPNVPANCNEISGQLVAQVALPPISEIADEAENFEVAVPATLPAGNVEHVMVLALVAGRGREFNDVQDLAVYPQREAFLHPRFNGAAGYRLEGDRVVLSAQRIENPRSPENLRSRWSYGRCRHATTVGRFRDSRSPVWSLMRSPVSTSIVTAPSHFRSSHPLPASGIWF